MTIFTELHTFNDKSIKNNYVYELVHKEMTFPFANVKLKHKDRLVVLEQYVDKKQAKCMLLDTKHELTISRHSLRYDFKEIGPYRD